MLSLLSMRSNFCVSALRTTGNEIFQPIRAAMTDYGEALTDKKRLDYLLQQIMNTYSYFDKLPRDERSSLLTSFHMPVYFYVSTMLQRHRKSHTSKPLFLGVSAPQVELIDGLFPS